MLHILHVITGLETGGAEAMLQRLIARSDPDRFRHSVVSLTTMGEGGRQLVRSGVPVTALGMGGLSGPVSLLRLARILRRERPDVVKSWLYHADLAAALAARVSRRPPVVWGVHNTTFASGNLRRGTIAVARICAWLSRRWPARIVSDSRASLPAHERIGYDTGKFVVIPNGFDTATFRPDPAARAELRRSLGLAEDVLLVGLVARFDVLKDHRNFLEAAARVVRERPGVHFVICGGNGVDASNATLAAWIDELGLRDAVHLLGRVADLPRFMAALDAGVSSSRSESFPLTVGEMMSCGVVCVVTDVGDSAYIVGDTGSVVPPRDAGALASAILTVLGADVDERQSRGAAARRRIIEVFSIEAVAARYDSLFAEVAAQ